MLTINVQIDGAMLERLAARLDQATLMQAAKPAMIESVELLRRTVRDAEPTDTGALRASIRTQVTGNTLGSLVGIVAPSGPPGRYALPMEYGRRPGSRMPPVEPLVRWAKRHKLGRTDKETRAIGFLIARAIARRGSPKARPQGYRAFETAARRGGDVQRIFARYFARIGGGQP